MSRASVAFHQVRSRIPSSRSDSSIEATTSTSPSANVPSSSPITTNQDLEEISEGESEYDDEDDDEEDEEDEEEEEEEERDDDDIGPSDSASRPRGVVPKPYAQAQARYYQAQYNPSHHWIPASDPPYPTRQPYHSRDHHYPPYKQEVELANEHRSRRRSHTHRHNNLHQGPLRQPRQPRPPNPHEMADPYFDDEYDAPLPRRRQVRHRYSDSYVEPQQRYDHGRHHYSQQQQQHYLPQELHYHSQEPQYYLPPHPAALVPPQQITHPGAGFFEGALPQIPTTHMVPYYQAYQPAPAPVPAAPAPAPAPAPANDDGEKFHELKMILANTEKRIMDQEEARLARKHAKEEEAARKEAEAKKAAAEKQAEDNFTKITKMMADYEKSRQEREEKAEKARVDREVEREAKIEAERKAKELALAEEAKKKKAAEALAQAEKKGKEDAQAEAAQKLEEAKKAHDKALKEAQEATKMAKEAEEAAKKEAATYKPTDDDKQPPVQFTDAIGRKYRFPWKVVKTWRGIEELIKQAFEDIEPISKPVLAGRYDLVDSSGEILLPRIWDAMIKPDASITMKMWPPKKEAPPVPPVPPMPPGPPGGAPPPGGPHGPHMPQLPAALNIFGRPTKSKRRQRTHYVVVPQTPSAPPAHARTMPGHPGAAVPPAPPTHLHSPPAPPVPPVPPVPPAPPAGGGGGGPPAMSSGQAAAMAMAGAPPPPPPGPPLPHSPAGIPARSPSVSSRRKNQPVPTLVKWVVGRR